MKGLLKKEFLLCLHPTCLVFLSFAAFVFIPNYPYEVMFFFSGLSVFFVCLMARENGDTSFTAVLPASRKQAGAARMLFCGVFQVALLLLAGVTTAIKQAVFPPEAQVNLAGSTANLAFLGNGALLLGLFNILFFPLYYAAPHKVGVPFLLAGAAQFLLVAVLIALRFSVPFWRDMLTVPDPANLGAKLAVFFSGVVFYAALSALGYVLSAKHFSRIDL